MPVPTKYETSGHSEWVLKADGEKMTIVKTHGTKYPKNMSLQLNVVIKKWTAPRWMKNRVRLMREKSLSQTIDMFEDPPLNRTFVVPYFRPPAVPGPGGPAGVPPVLAPAAAPKAKAAAAPKAKAKAKAATRGRPVAGPKAGKGKGKELSRSWTYLIIDDHCGTTFVRLC